MKNKNQIENYGFVKPEHDNRDFIFGSAFNSLPKTILQANGDWSPYLPLYERQFGAGWDSYGCTCFGTLNCLEVIMKKVYGTDFDFSERYQYNLIGIEPPGSDPKKVAQSIHSDGVLEQKDLPYEDNLNVFKSPRPMTKSLIDKGHLWLQRYGFGYEWIDANVKNLRECLQYSPIGVSVCAWYKNDKGQYYSPKGMDNNHWTLLYKIGDNGEFYVFDSYDQEMKVLTPEHNIEYAMRYNVEVKSPQQIFNNIQLNFISILLQYVANLFKKTARIGAEVITEYFRPRY